MAQTFNINVEHVTRVEGHGNIRVNVKEGVLEDVKLEITESPRFYEAMLRGRKWNEAVHITCRICGICSCGHTCASLQAMEAALGVTPSEQTVVLRKLLLDGEQLESHLLHVYFLAAPDLLGVGSVIPLVDTHREVVERALRMKRLACDICRVVAGRHIHPIAAVVNGFTKLPNMDDLLALRDRLVEGRADVAASVELFQALAPKIPQFEREMEFISLTHPDEYAFYHGKVKSTDGPIIDVKDYLTLIDEWVVSHSRAKHTKASRESYMVGALARFNNNHTQLKPEVQQAAEALGLKAPCYNPFMNNVAQLVEVAQCYETAIDRINWLDEHGLHEEDRTVQVKAGRGVGSSDVPRGILFHEYEIDDSGTIVDANLMIPTNQNLNNIEHDMRALVPEIIDQPPDDVRQTLEMLVRAYDPCISCATHLLDVEFV